MGEVWCVTLWKRERTYPQARLGAGNRLILQLVTDGMTLSPPNPNYLQAATHPAADLLDSGGANQNEE